MARRRSARHPSLKTFPVFPVNSPVTGPGEGKGFDYREDREEGNGGWLGEPGEVKRGFMVGAALSPCPLARGYGTHPLKTFVVFVFFVVKSPFTRPSEGKGFIYHEEHEGHEEGNRV